MYHHEYYVVYTIGYHSSSLGGHKEMLHASQHLISYLFYSQPLIFYNRKILKPTQQLLLLV